jgi:hypothetical protein
LQCTLKAGTSNMFQQLNQSFEQGMETLIAVDKEREDHHIEEMRLLRATLSGVEKRLELMINKNHQLHHGSSSIPEAITPSLDPIVLMKEVTHLICRRCTICIHSFVVLSRDEYQKRLK